MTELEILQRAKMYIDKLANGIDPITDKEMLNDTVLNNVRLARCFFYVSQVLEKVIQNGGKVSVKNQNTKKQFFITKEQLSNVETNEKPITISDFCKKIDNVVNDENMRRLSPVKLTSWLVEKGFLQLIISNDGKKKKAVCDKSKLIGITEEKRQGQYGSYTVNLYNLDAQKFILDNLEAILVETSNC